MKTPDSAVRLVSRYHNRVIELDAPVSLDEINEHEARALATAILTATEGCDKPHERQH